MLTAESLFRIEQLGQRWTHLVEVISLFYVISIYTISALASSKAGYSSIVHMRGRIINSSFSGYYSTKNIYHDCIERGIQISRIYELIVNLGGHGERLVGVEACHCMWK